MTDLAMTDESQTVQFMGAEIEVSGAADEAEARDIAFAWLADQEDA
jgi:hypothetical protein